MKRGIFGGYGRDTVEKFISATPSFITRKLGLGSLGSGSTKLVIRRRVSNSNDPKHYCVVDERYMEQLENINYQQHTTNKSIILT